MIELNNALKGIVKFILTNDTKNTIDPMLKQVYEGLMKAERNVFLKECPQPNKGNGHYERTAQGVTTTIDLSVPRDRTSTFKPTLVDILNHADDKMHLLAAKLYVKGLSTRDIEDILHGVFEKKLSPTTVSNITKEFQEQRKIWIEKKLESTYYFMYIDALFVPVRRGTVEKEAFYTVMGLRTDLRREILGVYNTPSESAAGWRKVIVDLKKRGLQNVLLIVADGLAGLDRVVKKEFPRSLFQRCIVHKFRNILLEVRASDKAEVAKDLREVFVLEDPRYTFKDAIQKLNNFIEKWKPKYPVIQRRFDEGEDLENYFSYLKFPHEIQRMIYTTNWIERLNRTIRKTQSIRCSFPNPDSALALIVACLIEQEEKFYLRYPLTEFTKVKLKLDAMVDEMAKGEGFPVIGVKQKKKNIKPKKGKILSLSHKKGAKKCR